MALLKKEDQEHLINEFASLTTPVKLIVFTQAMECQYCKETRMIAEEVASLSDLISVEVYDFEAHREIAEEYNIDKIPATVIMRAGDEPKDYGIRLFGIPSGYEFSTLIEDIMMVSSGESGLSAETKAWAAALNEPVHMQVFITPTCPYCPRAVILAHQLAMESELIHSDMVEAIEFPHLSNKYHVQGVPRTVINETVHMEGAAPEMMVLGKLKEAVA
ncbi:MAG: thioredoxin family protein [Anaerolineales bacterium]|nr:thioredoxin family protein [Anaerolineales bacterium]MCB9004578.1 thioredoxin family protein [Ardenticatenaceae bacterium]